MRKWVQEDWAFDLEVIRGEAEHCRLGLEKGDHFHFEYGCPEGFCLKTAALLYAYCETARCGGDFRLRGCKAQDEIEFSCADSCIGFRLKARYIGTKQ